MPFSFETAFFIGKKMRENLESMGYQNLRIYAKKIGVRCPTSLTKEKLIEKIREVESGKVEPHYTNRGRPRINNFIENDYENNKYLEKIETEKAELKNKFLELIELNEKIEKEFCDFKKIFKEIIKEL